MYNKEKPLAINFLLIFLNFSYLFFNLGTLIIISFFLSRLARSEYQEQSRAIVKEPAARQGFRGGKPPDKESRAF